MSTVYIAIEKSRERFDKYKALWEMYEITGIWAATMTEGIEKIIQSTKSIVQEIYFISIVASDLPDFMEKLSILRAETTAPILVATEDYTVKEHHKALNNGANFYGPFFETNEQNIEAVMAAINGLRNTVGQDTQSSILTHGGILISLSQRKSFVGGVNIELTRLEFDILHYFMSNIGSALSYEQIYRCVWNDEYSDSFIEGIKSTVKRLRRKIESGENCDKKIEKVRGFGYKMPL